MALNGKKNKKKKKQEKKEERSEADFSDKRNEIFKQRNISLEQYQRIFFNITLKKKKYFSFVYQNFVVEKL